MLFRNPEDHMAEWTAHQLLAQVQANSLFRLYAEPTGLSTSLDVLDNYEKLSSVVFKRAKEFPTEMLSLLGQYLRISRVGEGGGGSVESSFGQHYCVESKEYYRRDNFKLLERLENEELKRKGLFMRFPINLLVDTEINEQDPTKPFASARSLTPRRSTLSSQALKYTDLATRRHENSLRKQKIRKLFGRLDSLSRSANRLPLHPTLNCSRISKLNFSSPSAPQDRLRQSRNTVGALYKSTLRTEGVK